MGRYQAYPEYKDSGLEWFGDIPSDWDVWKWKHSLSSPMTYGANEAALDDDLKNPRYIRITDMNSDGSLRDDTFKSLPLEAAKNYLLKDGDILVARTGATVGKSFLYKEKFGAACFAGYLIRARIDKNIVEPEFVSWYLQSDQYWKYISRSQIQATLQNISAEKYGDMEIAIPPKRQDRLSIANFLDHETAKIDTLIEKQQQLIQLLKEKRQAVISHAVTKGLNPNVPMKDSGVEWLGEVPEHWEVKPLKFVISDKKGAVKAGPFGSHLKNSDMEGVDVKVVSQKNIIAKDFDIGEFMISKEKYKELAVFTIERNDILITTRGTIGRAAIYLGDEIAILHPCLIRIQVDLSRVFPEFIALLIEESGYVLEQILINSNSTTIEVIYSENLINTIVCLPGNLQEQEEILNYVKLKKEYFDSSIIKARQAIDLMQERRTALISAAVTGKIDVRLHASRPTGSA